MSSLRFVVSSLDDIAKSRDAQRNKQLGESIQAALTAIKDSETQQGPQPDPEVLFAALQLASKSSNVEVSTKALDCIGKLISYSFFTPVSASAEEEAPAGEDENGERKDGEGRDAGDSGESRESRASGTARAPLIDRAIDTICDCFQGEMTHQNIQVQIVSSLLAAVLNDKIVVHGAGLLKAIRQIYNVFLLSPQPMNQGTAQGTLEMMVGNVFARLKTRLELKEARTNLSKLKMSTSNVTFDRPESESVNGKASTEGDASPSLPKTTSSTNGSSAGGDADGDAEGEDEEEGEGETKLTLKDLEHRKSFDDTHMGDGPTMVTQLKTPKKPSRSVSGNSIGESTLDESPEAMDAEDEVYIRDAYLVFRAFCNLATKVLPHNQLYDLQGQAMRSKLISLHLIHTILNNYMDVFTSPLCNIKNTRSNESTSFLQAIKYYICLIITRNGACPEDKAFEVSAEIFWLMLKFMRQSFKKEIEVFLNEIYLALLARRTSPITQKLYVVNIIVRFCADSRGLVETYLNYDCDGNIDNIFQTIIEDLSKFATAPVAIHPSVEPKYEELNAKATPAAEWHLSVGIIPPRLSVDSLVRKPEVEPEIPHEYVLKRVALDGLVEALRSLVNWSSSVRPDAGPSTDANNRFSEDFRQSTDPLSHSASQVDTPIHPPTPVPDDDLEHLEKAKARKTAMTNAIKAFNFKPKNGIKKLLQGGFIPRDAPDDIARFLLSEERLDKSQIGEYLGEGEPKNIEIMHAFVDSMEFTQKRFVDALRQFLQSFRLPGEAQKIDRFMLKFANRYVMGNPNAFANADTAYVLAYSVIMLNTDLHSSKIAKRMSKEEFIKNNRGINDNADLPDDYLLAIYDEIANNEIVLKSEREAAAAAGTLPPQQGVFTQAFSNVARDLQREAYLQQSEEIASRSEQLVKTLLKNQRRNAAKAGSKFISATNVKHVGPMFDVTWMSFFSALSAQLQKTHNIDVSKLCLEGMKLATKIACLFNLSTPREAFISAIKNTTNLNNPAEILAKNVEALKTLLELGGTEGEVLGESWKDILMCISQLDRLQLISTGVDENSVPDVSKARFVPHERDGSHDSHSSKQPRRGRARARSRGAYGGFSAEILNESRSDEVIKAVDRIFTNTAKLGGEAMRTFAQALTEVSWDEIRVSGSNDSPRTYSLQKIVEISYYNMTRVRFEWTDIWKVLGEHFNRVGCHNNTAIVFFALDSLRQLSMRFMELEELAGFQFQKDFLKPFEQVLTNTENITVKDMVLRCLIQMIQARGDNIRSGWRTMFGVFAAAAREPHESIVSLAWENVSQVYRTKFGVVISQGAFTDLIVCLTAFSKNLKFQKKSLQALEALKSIIPRLLKTPECSLSQKKDTLAVNAEGALKSPMKSPIKPPLKSPNYPNQKQAASEDENYWFPVLFAFHDVLMTGEDLEVRSSALEYFFETLQRYGGNFEPEFWNILWRQQLEPIFVVLRSRPELSNALNNEELSVWLSTTMIQALRNMISLFTHFFESLEYMLDRFLKLLALCICQENDTISRIGGNCLQQLILKNVNKFGEEHWAQIVAAFCELFERTTAKELFFATTLNPTATLSPIANGFELTTPISPAPDAAAMPDSKSLRINGNDGGRDGDDDDLDVPETPGVAAMDGDKATSLAALGSPGMSSDGRTPTMPLTPALEDYKPASPLSQQPVIVSQARRRFFNRIISRCVLHLLMIETVNELFSNEAVYARIPSTELLRLMAVLKKSYLFARRFNADKELRMRLWRERFMKQPPNLLKQESGSAATYVAILFRMFADASPERARNRGDIEAALLPLCQDIIRGYVQLEEESQQRNVMAWRPVVVDVLEGYAAFPREAFAKGIPDFYPLVVELLAKEVSPELRASLLTVLRRVGEVGLDIQGLGGGSLASGMTTAQATTTTAGGKDAKNVVQDGGSVE